MALVSRFGRQLARASASRSAVRRMGGGGGGAIRPPFARTPVATEPLHEEHELIWDDGVAAETALDFDAQHISKIEGLKMFLGGFAFFFTLFVGASLTDPEGQRQAVPRCSPGAELPFGGAHIALGKDPETAPADEDAEEEDDDE
mmetsp:Transcript_10471/g.24337  ORF Transcript_10471/g.24337 Transcript_10471/m.24337 type:complete len:145 (+) Transcript_10471:44-478(+)